MFNALQHKRAQEALRESEERYRQLVELSPDAIAVHSEGKIVFINRSGVNFYGADNPDQLIGKPVLDIIHPDYREIVKERTRHMLKGRKAVFSIEEKFILKDGTVVYGEVVAAPLTFQEKPAVLVVIRDINKRKKAEQALRSSEERFSKVFNFSPYPMSITTLKDGRYIAVNESFVHLGGYSRSEVIGSTSVGLKIWANEEERQKVIQTLLNKGEIHNLEVHVDTKSGDLRTILFSSVIVSFGNEQYILSVVNDITELKKFEKEMARLDQLNLVGQMAAGIGHEIRNPMTTVRGFLQVLSGKKECVEYKEFYNLMIDEIDRANSIITEYLSLARNKPIDLQSQSLNTIVESLYPLIQADALNANKSIEIRLNNIPNILVNEKEIRQVILNLSRNGFEAMDAGGVLTISTYMEGNEVILAVQDQGKGIEPEVLEKIGIPFFTTKDNGTGLGLAVCHSIAKRHNAVIKTNTGSQGTTFLVSFKKI